MYIRYTVGMTVAASPNTGSSSCAASAGSSVSSAGAVSPDRVSSTSAAAAVSSGSAVITVTCGAKAAQCTVLCDFEDASDQTAPVKVDHLALNKDDMTFFSAGESYVLTVTNVPAGTRVEWKSMDEAVATVDENGHVEAVGGGTTRVIAVVDGLQAECWVRCRFE